MGLPEIRTRETKNFGFLTHMVVGLIWIFFFLYLQTKFSIDEPFADKTTAQTFIWLDLWEVCIYLKTLNKYVQEKDQL